MGFEIYNTAGISITQSEARLPNRIYLLCACMRAVDWMDGLVDGWVYTMYALLRACFKNDAHTNFAYVSFGCFPFRQHSPKMSEEVQLNVNLDLLIWIHWIIFSGVI